jgi:hypothetical protein
MYWIIKLRHGKRGHWEQHRNKSCACPPITPFQRGALALAVALPAETVQAARDEFFPWIALEAVRLLLGSNLQEFAGIRPIQVIDGKRTFTFPDLQPCRLLQCLTIRTVNRIPGVETYPG